MDLYYSDRGGRPTPERLATYRKDKWTGGTILRVLCASGDNEYKRQYVYGLYDKQTGRPLPGYGRDRCPGFTKSCRD